MYWIFKAVFFISTIGYSDIKFVNAADPMAPAGYRAEASPKSSSVQASPRYVLNQIIVGTSSSIAVINGKALAIGETVEAATVVSIDEYKVQINVKGKREWLSIDAHYPTIRR